MFPLVSGGSGSDMALQSSAPFCVLLTPCWRISPKWAKHINAFLIPLLLLSLQPGANFSLGHKVSLLWWCFWCWWQSASWSTDSGARSSSECWGPGSAWGCSVCWWIRWPSSHSTVMWTQPMGDAVWDHCSAWLTLACLLGYRTWSRSPVLMRTSAGGAFPWAEMCTHAHKHCVVPGEAQPCLSFPVTPGCG